MKDSKPQYITSIYINGELYEQLTSLKDFRYNEAKTIVRKIKSEHIGYNEIYASTSISPNRDYDYLCCLLNTESGIALCITVVNQLFTGFVDKNGNKIYDHDWLDINGVRHQINQHWSDRTKFYIRYTRKVLDWTDTDIHSQEDLNKFNVVKI